MTVTTVFVLVGRSDSKPEPAAKRSWLGGSLGWLMDTAGRSSLTPDRPSRPKAIQRVNEGEATTDRRGVMFGAGRRDAAFTVACADPRILGARGLPGRHGT